MLDPVSKILFVVSSSTLIPVILALLGLAVWVLLLLGGVLSECLARVSARRTLGTGLAALRGSDPQSAARRVAGRARGLSAGGFLCRYLKTCWAADATDPAAAKTVDDIELEMQRATANLFTVARLGPMLGLAGTLIPLGPGLVSLARGDVAGLANQLVIAFSTTIVGLLIGVIAFGCAHVRRGWYARDLADILFLEDVRSRSEWVAA